MTPAAKAALRALSGHDMDWTESDAYERLAEAALTAGDDGDSGVQYVAYVLDREQLGIEQAPETQAAARDVVVAVKAVAG